METACRAWPAVSGVRVLTDWAVLVVLLSALPPAVQVRNLARPLQSVRGAALVRAYRRVLLLQRPALVAFTAAVAAVAQVQTAPAATAHKVSSSSSTRRRQ